MDKNLLIAVSLSIAVYALWFGLIEKRFAPAPPPRSAPAAAAPDLRAQGAPPSTPEASSDRNVLLKDSEPASLGASQVRIARRGAAIVSWQDPEPLGTVELVEYPTPGFFATWPDLDFQRGAQGAGVTYQATRPDGLKIEKTFLPGEGDRLPRLRITVFNAASRPLEGGGWTLSLGPGLGTIATEQKENPKVWRALGLLKGEGGLEGKIETLKPGEHAGAYQWVGIDNRYFLAAVLPQSQDFASLFSAIPPGVTLTAGSVTLGPGESRSWEIPYYVGAKGHTWLSRYKAGLERSINFGFFSQLGRFILKILNRIHAVTGNWGWSIILLTLMLQVVLFPLTFKSLKATTAMRRLQPEIAKLQQKYAKEPSKLNAEMMELYKKHGANPLGGCLPMLLQMPIFISLYNALRNAWELHGAPWTLWIKDLSAKDPYYVLPLVMGGLMFAQNKLNPPPGDPAQAQMMTWMPVIFTFMFMNFPSGLVLYWLTNSLLSTAQQLALKRHFDQNPGRGGNR